MSEWRPEDPASGYPSGQGAYGGPPTGSYPAGQQNYPVQTPNGWPQQGGYPPGYPPAGYQPGYQPGYPPGYPPMYGYPPMPQVPPGERRPGTLTAAAVLGYVLAGLLIFAGVLMFFGASIVRDYQNAFDSSDNYDLEFVLDGIANLIAGGLLIAGAVMMSGRNTTGRLLYGVGGAIVIAMSVYWIARWGTHFAAHGLIVYALLFDALAIVGLSMSFTGADNRWLAGRNAKPGGS